MKNIFITLVFVFSINIIKAQSPIFKIIDNISYSKENLNDSLTIHFKKLKNHLIEIRTKQIDFKKIKGKTEFLLNGNTAEDRGFVLLGSNIELNHGVYPQEFSLKTSFQIQIEDGKFQENLSNMHLSYDRFFQFDKEVDSHILEAFAFMNRESNQFLNVSSRYQVGGGVIVAYWSKMKKSIDEKVKPLDYKFIYAKNNPTKMIVKTDSIKIDSFSLEDFKSIQKINENIKNNFIKNESPFRIGLLVGALYEAENITVKDSIVKTDLSKKLYEHKFKTSSKFRWELRPTFDFSIAKFAKVRIRPLIVLPMPWDWYRNIEGKKTFDFRASIPFDVSVDLSANFTMGINYTINYDNAPSSIELVSIDQDYTGFLTANKFHQNYTFKVGYKF